jgi:hypothetical protein
MFSNILELGSRRVEVRLRRSSRMFAMFRNRSGMFGNVLERMFPNVLERRALTSSNLPARLILAGEDRHISSELA